MKILERKLLSSRSGGTGAVFVRSCVSLCKAEGEDVRARGVAHLTWIFRCIWSALRGVRVWLSCPLELPFSPQDLRNTVVIAP